MKKLDYRPVTTILIGLLLIFLGAMAEYRYSLIQHTPFNVVNSRKIGLSNDVSSAALARVINGQAPADHDSVDMGIFWQTWKLLESQYYLPEKIDPQKMVDGAVAGLVASLGDPYTAYLPAKENERSGQDLAGSFYGVGIELGFSDDGILSVVAPLDGTPAANAGLQPNDLIIKVKDPAKNLDEATSGWTLDKAVDSIRGPKGSKVTLTMLRRGPDAQPFDVELERGEIVVKSVKLEFPTIEGKKVAHLKLSKFGERTQDEWDIAVNQILKQRGQISGIVLDMRNNPGGLFDDAIYIASDFIESGVVVSQKGKYTSQDFETKGAHRLKGIPVVVLVNQGSASASEIVAGALKDQLNAPLVGQKTFGKGTVQDRIPLSNDAGLHVTIAQWLTPSGNWIHDKGIEVNTEIKDDPATKDVDEQLIAAAAQFK
jgi:carboxyl-terminal processing protease